MYQLVQAIAQADPSHLADVLREESKSLGIHLMAGLQGAEACGLLTRALQIHMHGVVVPRALVPAIMLAQDPDARCKRVGQLAACCLMSPQDISLLPLLQNTLRKDLCSQDFATVSVALVSISRIADAEMCAALAPLIEDIIDHPSGTPPALRAKAISALSRCWRVCGQAMDSKVTSTTGVDSASSASQIERLRTLLHERGPAVLSATAGALRALPDHQAVARQLLPELLAAQCLLVEQPVQPIGQRTAPHAAWTQVALLRLVEIASRPHEHPSALASPSVAHTPTPARPEEAEVASTEGKVCSIEDVLLSTLQRHADQSVMSFAISSIAVSAAAYIGEPSDALLRAMAGSIVRMVRRSEPDVQHAGLRAARAVASGPNHALVAAIESQVMDAALRRLAIGNIASASPTEDASQVQQFSAVS